MAQDWFSQFEVKKTNTDPEPKRDDWFDQFQAANPPVNTAPPAPVPTVEEPSLFDKLYNAAFNAPKFITEPARDLANYITTPELDDSAFTAGLKGFAGGAVEGAASQLSPANVLTLGRGKLPQIAARIAGGLDVGHGLEEIYHGNYSEGAGDIGAGILMGLTPSLHEKPNLKPIVENPNAIEIPKEITTEPRPAGPWNENINFAEKPKAVKSDEDLAYDLARQKFQMGLDNPSLANEAPKADQPSIMADVEKLKNSPTRKTFTFDYATGEFKNVESLPKTKEGFVSLKDAGTPEELQGKLNKITGKEPKTQTGGSNPPPPNENIHIASSNAEPIIRKMKLPKPEEASALREAWNTSRGLMAVDLPFITSAGFRQGLPLIGTKNWFKAWVPSVKSFGSKAAYEAHSRMIDADPLVQKRLFPVLRKDGSRLIKDGRPVYKEVPGILEEAGVHLADNKNLSFREESIRSQWAERIPVYGKYVAASNRAYTAYINDLRLNTFRNLYSAMDNKNDIVALRQLGDFVSTTTGRGPLRTRIPFGGDKEFSLEKYAQQASEVLFAPKLIASRLQMVNPMNYVTTAPQVRKEYVKALARTAGAWMTMASLGKLAGAEVVLDPTSADFGKMKFGNVRLDPAGGFQQYLVLAARLKEGGTTSSTTGRFNEFGKGYKPETAGSTVQHFIENKLHPSLKYFYDAAFAEPNRPFRVLDRSVELAVPMLSADLIQIAQEEPELLPFLAPLVSGGMGLQSYEKGSFSDPKFIPEEYDYAVGSKR